MALFRTKSLTVSLMAFSGATPCCPTLPSANSQHHSNRIGHKQSVVGQGRDRIQQILHCGTPCARSRNCSCTAAVRRPCFAGSASESRGVIEMSAITVQPIRQHIAFTLTADRHQYRPAPHHMGRGHSPRSIGYTIVAPNAPAIPTKQLSSHHTASRRGWVRTSQAKVVDGVRNLVKEGQRVRGLCLCSLLGGRTPPRVEQLRKFDEGESLLRAAASSKVEDDRGLHGGEERVARRRGTVVQEVGLVDAPVLGLGRGLANDATERQQKRCKRDELRTARSCPFLPKAKGSVLAVSYR